MAPKYAMELCGLRLQLMSKRSPGLRPSERNPAPNPAIRPGTSAAGNVCPVAASIRSEPFPSRSTNRPAKFQSLEMCTCDLTEFGLHHSADLLHVLHGHQVIHVKSQSKSTLEAARQVYMSHGIPGGNVVR